MGELTKINLREHRLRLKKSGKIGPTDEEKVRLLGSLDHHLRACRYLRVPLPLKQDFVERLFRTQLNKPFFWITSTLPFCWNSPKDFNKDYIIYQWGHLFPQSGDIKRVHRLQNLSLMSARCNNHIQSSLSISELPFYFKGSRVGDRIEFVMRERRALFASSEWRALERDFERHRSIS